MRARVWVGFAVFCAAAGSRWLLDQAVPSPLGGLLRLGMHHLILLPVWLIWCVVGRLRVPGHWGRIALLGVLVWALPEAVIWFAGGQLSGLTEALVFTLVPVVVVFTVAQLALGFGGDEGPRRLVGPALAGVVGAGLLIPFDAPPSSAGKLWLAALVGVVVMAALAAVGTHKELRGVGLAPAALITGGAVAFFSLAKRLGSCGACEAGSDGLDD